MNEHHLDEAAIEQTLSTWQRHESARAMAAGKSRDPRSGNMPIGVLVSTCSGPLAANGGGRQIAAGIFNFIPESRVFRQYRSNTAPDREDFATSAQMAAGADADVPDYLKCSAETAACS